jgi:hypothetical protein
LTPSLDAPVGLEEILAAFGDEHYRQASTADLILRRGCQGGPRPSVILDP